MSDIEELAWWRSMPTSMRERLLEDTDVIAATFGILGDGVVQAYAAGVRDVLTPAPLCDCPMDPYHRWNCPATPIWSQTIRDLDTNPWTVLEVS